MANELAALASWTFFQEVAIPQDIGALMVNGDSRSLPIKQFGMLLFLRTRD